jgi:hypothetical protein
MQIKLWSELGDTQSVLCGALGRNLASVTVKMFSHLNLPYKRHSVNVLSMQVAKLMLQ